MESLPKEKPPPPRIVDVDRLDEGVFVSFADGASALYSAELLYATLNQAERLQTPTVKSAPEPPAPAHSNTQPGTQPDTRPKS